MLLSLFSVSYGIYTNNRTEQKTNQSDKDVADCRAQTEDILQRSSQLYDMNTALKHQVAERTEQLAAAQKQVDDLKSKKKQRK
jgi:hypothetical protein